MERLIPGRLIGLQGRLARPFWGVMGIWAVLCGAIVSNHFRWGGDDLLTLGLVLLLAELAWGSIWDLATGTDWFRPLADGWPPAQPASLIVLPYTQHDSPSGRLSRRIDQLVGLWREVFWPAAGPALLALVAAAALAGILTLLLPNVVRGLNAMLVALVGLGVAWRRRGRTLLAGQALVQVGLCWLAGHLAFAEMSWSSLLLGLAFAVAVWGSMRVAKGLVGGLWLLDGGQVICMVLLAAQKQALAASAVGILLLGQMAMQPSLCYGGERMRVFRRTWPWLMVAMLVAAFARP